jgi:hypothetical protein
MLGCNTPVTCRSAADGGQWPLVTSGYSRTRPEGDGSGYRPNLDEVQLFATPWMYNYKHDCPNMALGGITPKQRLAMAA